MNNAMERAFENILLDRHSEAIEAQEDREDEVDKILTDIREIGALLAPKEKVSRTEALEYWERAAKAHKRKGGMGR